MSRAVDEKTYSAERASAGVRLAVIGLNTAVYVLFLGHAGHTVWLAYAVIAVAWAYALYVWVRQPFRHHPILLTSYFTSISDGTLITLWLYATGGFNSPYYLLWYISIVVVAFRFDYRQTMAAATLYSAAYLVLAAALGQAAGHWSDLFLRIGYIFLVGALGGELGREALKQHRAKVEAEERSRVVAEAESKFRAVAETAKDAIITTDLQGTVVYFNQQAERTFGYTVAQMTGRPALLLFPPHSRAAYSSYLGGLLRDGQPVARPIELTGLHHDGHEIPLEVSLARWESNEGTFVTGISRDVTERKQAEEALTHQALYDPLTELPNRRLFQDRLRHALVKAHREQVTVCVLLIDLDFFKDVNDTFGHSFGDVLLQAVSERLRRLVRASDTIARLGGDEFAVLLEGVGGATDAIRTAEKMLQLFAEPFGVEGETITVGGSIGVAVSPAHGEDAETLLRHADVAMYAAKSSRDGYALYAEEQDQDLAGRLSLLNDLRQAIQRSELALHYQPKVTVVAGEGLRVEALARWLHPRLGPIGPDHFIPLAERGGLINALTSSVLDKALEQCAAWRREGLEIGVAVNLSVRNLHDPKLLGTVNRLLAKWRVPAHLLGVEVTESTIMANPGHVRQILTELASTGISISIDDFGTGYSSLAYLKRLPAQELKIDKSFVQDMGHDDNDAVIVRSTIEMAHNLGLRVVAEGVETGEVWRQLAALGCDEVQGFYIGRPMPAEELARWAAGRSRSSSGSDGHRP
ncbi:MAG: EAL domain-containing protein [Chloroflexota bacterium]|nr:EAL domain-containing protein [Chloroflexota bacterium]